jgi:hypothetical protein
LALAVIGAPRDRHQAAADVVITAPGTSSHSDLADVGANHLGAVEASARFSRQVSATQPFAEKAGCSRGPAKSLGLDLTSAEKLS